MTPIPDDVVRLFDRHPGLQPIRVALQVNPYPYIVAQGMQDDWGSSSAFNDAMANAAAHAGIGLVAITDHHRSEAEGLDVALRARGVVVLPGVEITASDNIHILGVFPEGTPVRAINDVVARCDRDQEGAGTGAPIHNVVSEIVGQSGLAIASHVMLQKTGMLVALRGQARATAWSNADLAAAGLDVLSPLKEIEPAAIRDILMNRDAQHRRDKPLPLINAADVSTPEDFAKTRSSTFMRMETPSFRGLQLAFTDAGSRIDRPESPSHVQPEVDHPFIVGIAWEGGQADGVVLPLHSGLNVLVGGRGSGKSTVVESVRYVAGLPPPTERFREVHTSLINDVLGSAALVHLAVQRGDERLVISREGGGAPRVRNTSGTDLGIRVTEPLPRLRVLGQHEIAEIAHDDEARRALLDPLLSPDDDDGGRELRAALQASRGRLLQARQELKLLDEQAEELAALTAELDRLRTQGVEQHIARVTAEDRLIARIDELATWARSLEPLHADLSDRLAEGPQSIMSDARLDQLKAPEAIRALRARLGDQAQEIHEAIGLSAKTAQAMITDIEGVRSERAAARDAAEEQANALLRLEDTGHQQAAQEFRRKVQRRQRLEDVPRRRTAATRLLKEAEQERRELLADLSVASARTGTAHAEAAQALTNQAGRAAERAGVDARVRARHGRVTDAAALRSLLDEGLSGHRKKLLDALTSREQREILAVRGGGDVSALTGRDLVARCQDGAEVVSDELPGTTPAQAAAICEATSDHSELSLRLEEVCLRDHVDLQLLVDGEWRDLSKLSVGQQATAVLLVLLATDEGPLVLDQPEDDLDNEFIVNSIVPLLRAAKSSQQYVLSSHNANIPVLGDADLVTVLEAYRDGQGRPGIRLRKQGAIDDQAVQERIETLLEGGRQAFDDRRRRYGAIDAAN